MKLSHVGLLLDKEVIMSYTNNTDLNNILDMKINGLQFIDSLNSLLEKTGEKLHDIEDIVHFQPPFHTTNGKFFCQLVVCSHNYIYVMNNNAGDGITTSIQEHPDRYKPKNIPYGYELLERMTGKLENRYQLIKTNSEAPDIPKEHLERLCYRNPKPTQGKPSKRYTALIREREFYWIGYIKEFRGMVCQAATAKKLLNDLTALLKAELEDSTTKTYLRTPHEYRDDVFETIIILIEEN